MLLSPAILPRRQLRDLMRLRELCRHPAALTTLYQNLERQPKATEHGKQNHTQGMGDVSIEDVIQG
jgi:hypothetical protein